MLICFAAMIHVSVGLSTVWAMLIYDSEVYRPGALSSTVINVGFMVLCYVIVGFIVVPTFKCMLKRKEDSRDCCTYSFYRAFLTFASVGLIGSFTAGLTQFFVAEPFANNGNITSNETNTVSDSSDTLGLVTAALNFFTALLALVLIAVIVIIIKRNPQRRCGHDAHCVNACVCFNLLFIGVSVIFILIVESLYLDIFTRIRPTFSFSQGNKLLTISLSGGLFVIVFLICACCGLQIMTNSPLKSLIVTVVWVGFSATGCFVGGFFMSHLNLNETQYFFSISTFTYVVGILCFVIATLSCLTLPFCTILYCYFRFHHQEGKYPILKGDVIMGYS